MHEDKRIIEFTVEVVVEPDDVGFYAYCPALKGLHVGGETKKEALQNAADAAILYVSSLIKHGDSIPIGVGFKTSAEPSKPYAILPLGVRNRIGLSMRTTNALKSSCSGSSPATNRAVRCAPLETQTLVDEYCIAEKVEE